MSFSFSFPQISLTLQTLAGEILLVEMQQHMHTFFVGGTESCQLQI